jgi:hypothetical protein
MIRFQSLKRCESLLFRRCISFQSINNRIRVVDSKLNSNRRVTAPQTSLVSHSKYTIFNRRFQSTKSESKIDDNEIQSNSNKKSERTSTNQSTTTTEIINGPSKIKFNPKDYNDAEYEGRLSLALKGLKVI